MHQLARIVRDGANVRSGCRAGADCPYIHDVSAREQNTRQPGQQLASQRRHGKSQDSPSDAVTAGFESLRIDGQQSKSGTTTPQTSQSQRPVSMAEKSDPREFQINQLRRRFRPEEKTDVKETTLTFGLTPSDPDFPFELDNLRCVLHVPISYPGTGRPKLSVTNPEMDTAYQENVARGFDHIVDFTIKTKGQGTLLNWMNTLDKQLERLLTSLERGPRLKFVANIGDVVAAKEPTPRQEAAPNQCPTTGPAPVVPSSRLQSQPTIKPVATRTHTPEQRAEAEKRRSTETKQLEARLGRLPLFQKRTDTSFIVPIQPIKHDRLPNALQAVKTVKLVVPQLYPLEHSAIEIQANESPEARSVEIGFAQWVEQNSQMNLVSQINYLASNMHNFAKTPLPEAAEQAQGDAVFIEPKVPAPEPADLVSTDATEDRPHLHVIPRPPEWSVPDPHSGSDMTDESSYEEESEEEMEGDEDGGALVPAAVDTPGRGVALSFPFLELYGIELLEIIHLAITIKCERCKQSSDIKNVPHVQDPKATPKIESCKKCANSMSIGKSDGYHLAFFFP